MPISPILPEHSDHALMIHVWHLDTLDELAGYVAHFTPGADRFVTYPDSFSSDIRQTIAETFPGASYIPVKNQGQDVGALFQLMDQVDLSRYEFICKIHTKKGLKMPDEWRRALLGGVLGSSEQVAHIVKTFREDSDVQLAGARQLFWHGSTNLWRNAPEIDRTYGRMIAGFDFRKQDWGFIAGTCFWIRTAALLRIKDWPIRFDLAGGYVDDGRPAHAVERMFGMYAALSGGKVLLQDLRFPGRMPDVSAAWPDDVPKGLMRIMEVLSAVSDSPFLQSGFAMTQTASQPDSTLSSRQRVAVFASFSSDGFLPAQVLPYLAGLKPLTKAIVIVCDNDLAPGEREKLAPFAAHIITGRHGEYDFGSYKRGIACAQENGLLDDADDLILCNDSCYGPVGSFAPMFEAMEARGLDFWGATDSHQFSYHLQSYWVVLGRKVFRSDTFKGFIEGVQKKENVQQVIQSYELGLTKCLMEAGFKAGAYVENTLKGVHPLDPSYNNLTAFPLYTLEHGLPLVKTKALRTSHHNTDGPNRLLVWLRENAQDIYENAVSEAAIRRFEGAGDVAFSLVMPTRNRAWCISRAITSVMAQTHSNFELIIVDDGSTDDTEGVISRDFAEELVEGRIKYIRLPENVGVCNARNIGVAHARNAWIGYVDSDNSVRPYYLTVMANLIVENPNRDALYGQVINVGTGVVVGRPFNRDELVEGNFIDLGAFMHRRSLIARFGMFDPDLKRLVDWDLIIRFTGHANPSFISRVFLDYTDEESADRISVKESFIKAKVAIHTKHTVKPTVSTAILSYNHQEYLVQAIEGALAQKGNFTHEILISDDGSTDGTQRIIRRYAEKYPMKIRDISRGGNFGVSNNYRHCFREASGQYIAILEGDDYWIDDEKNLKQAEFLNSHPEAGMVFSRIELFDEQKNHRRLLKRQENRKELLTGADFANDQHLNLIVNLSSAMYIKRVMNDVVPSSLYEPRISEISLAFFFDRIGKKIGFLNEVMSVYRLNPSSVWTGASEMSQLKQAIAVREGAWLAARPEYRTTIREHIDVRKAKLAALESVQMKEKTA